MAGFLVDASLPRATEDLIRTLGHEATDVRTIGLGDASDRVIAEYARANRLALITRDQDFGNILDYPPQDYSGIVVVAASHEANRMVVLDMIRGLFAATGIAEQLPGRLVILERTRIRVREASKPDPQKPR